MMTLVDLDLFYGNVKLCNLGFSVGKGEKVDFSKPIAACDLKLIEFMKIVSDLIGNPEDRFSHNEAHF